MMKAKRLVTRAAIIASLVAASIGPAAQAQVFDVDEARDVSQQSARSNATMSIADAVAITVSRHPDIAQAFAGLARGRADVGAARSAWLPVLSYQGNVGPNRSSTSTESGLNEGLTGAGISIQQLVWDFGRSRGQIDAASAIERQRQHELEATADQLSEEAALAFLEVKRFELLQAAAAEHTRSLERLRDLIQARSEAGISDKSDLLLAEVRVESARGDEIQARTSSTSAKLKLANLTGSLADRYDDPAPVIARFAHRQSEPEFDDLPSIAAADEAERAAAARIGEIRAERLPRLGLRLGYDHDHDSQFARSDAANESFTALLTVTGNLYRADTRHLIRAAKEDRRAARALRDSAILDIRGRALAAREEIRGGYERIEAYRRQERRAITSSEIFLEEYKLGKRSLSDLLSSQLEIYRAVSSRIAAEYDILRARIQYESIHGALRQSLGVATMLEATEPSS